MGEVVNRLAELDARFSHEAEVTWDDVAYLAETVRSLRGTLQEIADHPIVSEDPGDNCDWHCTSTMVARAKDALAK